MKFAFLSFLLTIGCCLGAQVPKTINYKDFLSRQDLVFDSLSTKWEEGAFLGNGLLGMMVYREDSNALRFDLGRTDVVDHREGINPSIGRARLPIGRLVLRPEGRIRKIRLRLDLWNAELTGTIFTTKGNFTIQALVAATKDLMIVRVGTKQAQWTWFPEKALSPFLQLGRDTASKYPANPDPAISVKNGVRLHYQPLLAGGSYTVGIKPINPDLEQTRVITITNSVPLPGNYSSAEWKQMDPTARQNDTRSLSDAFELLDGLSAKGLQKLIDAHRQYWHQFYQQSFISIPDKRLESFWWIQQYKMAAATRKGAYPIDLMGPWYHITPWPKYWWNLNIQLTYYPFFSSNHVDLALPLLKMIDDNIDHLSKNAPPPYQYNAAALARSGPYDMNAPLKVMKGNDSTSNGSASLELGNLTWLLHVCYQSYEHTMDRQYLQRIYPVLTRAVNYYLDVVTKEADGKYHLPFTYSPEYPKGITRDANYDLSVLNWGLKTLLYINKELKYGDKLAPVWQDLLDHLVPYQTDQLGFRIGRDASFTESHRHYSHLLMVYPIYDVNWDQPENRELITRSLYQWKNNNAAWRGYSYTGSGSIFAMMGEGDSTWKMLNEMMKGRFSIKPNTMYLEAGPVIETPLSAVTTMNEMLLQSWGGILRIFPAVPASWQEASFDHLLAKGAFEVSAVRREGKTVFIRIRSLAGQPCKVKTGWSAPVHAKGKRDFQLVELGDGIISIDLKRGEEVTLFTDAAPSSIYMNEAKGDNNKNYWGLHNNE